MQRIWRTALVGVWLGLGGMATTAPAAEITVGSKNFAESRLLAELFAQLIESRTELRVDRKLGLAGTQVCFEALKSGAIDIYPEYSGTGLVSILDAKARLDRTQTYRRVRSEFLRRWQLVWLPPLGFENAYELAVPRRLAALHGLESISDLVPHAPEMTAGFGYEFLEREDGYPGLRRTYGLEFDKTIGMQQALKYQAAGLGEIECLDVYTTDGRLVVHDLQVLRDDRQFFPPYEAAALIRQATLRDFPQVLPVLLLLSNAINEESMRHWNKRIESEGESIQSVAASALDELGLVLDPRATHADAPATNFIEFFWQSRGELLRHTLEHLLLSGMGVLLGIAFAVPLALWLSSRRGWGEPVIRLMGTSQTIPSLALLAFMIPLLGVGVLPAIMALWIYALFPILRNTYTGLRDADTEAVEAGRALGMTNQQILRAIRLPLALPFIMAGIRTSSVISIGTATLAAFIGAGGLGVPIVSGVQSVDTALILSGAIPAALLAIGVDALLGWAEKGLRPKGG